MAQRMLMSPQGMTASALSPTQLHSPSLEDKLLLLALDCPGSPVSSPAERNKGIVMCIIVMKTFVIIYKQLGAKYLYILTQKPLLFLMKNLIDHYAN